MTEYTEDDVLFGEIYYARQGVPTANIVLKDTATEVGPDDTIKINGKYTSPNTSKIYPATHDFKDEVIGTIGTNIVFIDTDSSTGTCYATIIQYLDGHNKILQLYDDGASYRADVYNTISPAQTYGTIEFWVRITDASRVINVQFMNSATARFGIRISNDSWGYYDGAWHDIAPTPLDNTWYHVSIDFECTSNTYRGLAQYKWQFRIDGGVIRGPYTISGSVSNIDEMRLVTNDASGPHSVYFDAIGYSWDTGYVIGDNVYWRHYKDGMAQANFEGDDSFITGTDITFIDTVTTGTPQIIPLQDTNHKKILRVNSETVFTHNFASARTTGKVEWYMKSADVGEQYGVQFLDEGDAVALEIAFKGSNIQSFDNSGWSSDLVATNDVWYHIKVVFETTTDTWSYYINGVLENSGTLASSPTSIDHLKFTGFTVADIYLDPESTAIGQWLTQGSANHHENVDDAIRSPSTGWDGNYNYVIDGGENDVDQYEYETESLSGRKVKTVKVWLAAKEGIGTEANATINLNIDGSWQTAQNVVLTTSTAWHSYSFTHPTGTWDESDINDLKTRIIAPSAIGDSPPETIQEHAVYIELIFEATENIDFDAFGFSWESDYSEGDNLLTETPEPTFNTVLFDGRIETVDIEEAQGIYCVDKAQELFQIRPTGAHVGYNEVIIARMLYDHCNYVQMDRFSIIETVVPNQDVAKGSWDDPNGNNNDILYDDIDEGEGNEDGVYIEQNVVDSVLQIGFTNHTLSSDYHYEVYKIRFRIRHRYSGVWSGYYVSLYDGINWHPALVSSPTTSWTWAVINVSPYNPIEWSVAITEDEIISIKGKIDPTSTGDIDVDVWDVNCYCYYYDSEQRLDKSTNKTTMDLKGESIIIDLLNQLSLQDLKTWYLDPQLNLYWNSAGNLSGYNVTTSSPYSNIKGTRQIKSFDKVEIYGGYIGANRLIATAGTGNIIAIDTYSKIRDQTVLNSLAAQILSERGANVYNIEIQLDDEAIGLLQVGETINIGSGIKFDNTGRSVPSNDYVIDAITLSLAEGGVYDSIQLSLKDVLTFSIQEGETVQRNTKTTKENAETVGQMGTGKPSIYIRESNPGVGNDVDDGYQVGDFWLNITDYGLFVCVNNSVDDANWDEITKT